MSNTMDQKKVGKIADSLIESLVTSSMQEQEAVAEINQSDFQSVSMPGVIAGRMLSSLFTDQELFDIFNNSQSSRQSLCTIATAEAYAAQTGDPKFKEKLKEVAKSGNQKSVLDFISAHNFASIDDKKLEQLLEDRIAGLLSIPGKRVGDKEFAFEDVTGKLGDGIRVASNDYYFEHRNIGTNSILRVIKEGDRYKAVVNISKINPKQPIESYKLFHDTCCKIFGIKNNYDTYASDIRYNIQRKVKKFEKKIFEKSYNGYKIIFNGKDNIMNSSFSKHKKDILYNTDATISSILGCVGFLGSAISVGEGHSELVPYFASGFAIGIGGAIYFGVTNNGIIGNAVQSKAMKSYKKKYLADDSSLSNFMRTYNSYISSKDTSKETDSRIKAQSRLDEIKDTFEDVKYKKGFTVEFQSSSLDDIYLKSYAIIDKMNKVN